MIQLIDQYSRKKLDQLWSGLWNKMLLQIVFGFDKYLCQHQVTIESERV